VTDLPVFGKASLIFLRSRKFYCRQEGCPLKIFAERFENHFRPYRRKTERLERKIRQLGLLSGGKPTERICGILSIFTSDTTILRFVKKECFPSPQGVTAVGVDDWAYQKRDSYSNYRKAIATGAPQAVQVTDRWHLLKNLSEVVQKVLIKQYSKANAVLAGKQLRDEAREPVFIRPGPDESKSSDQSARSGIRLQRFKQLKELQGKGYSIRAMARHLGMHRLSFRLAANVSGLGYDEHYEALNCRQAQMKIEAQTSITTVRPR